jgi:hypothetical protein
VKQTVLANFGGEMISSMKAVHQFKSATRPLLLEANNDKRRSFILKNESVYRDAATLALFRAFNARWKEAGLPFRVGTYDAFPFPPQGGLEFGLLEAVGDSMALSDVNAAALRDEAPLANSLISCVTASFVAGVRDRHDGNFLLQERDGSQVLYAIDFGHSLGHTSPVIDTNRCAVPQPLARLFQPRWVQIVHSARDAFRALKEPIPNVLLQDVAAELSQIPNLPRSIRDQAISQVSEALRVHDQEFAYLVARAPQSVKKKVKDGAHAAGQQGKSKLIAAIKTFVTEYRAKESFDPTMYDAGLQAWYEKNK